MNNRILIIEDDHDILDIMRYIMEDEGYEVSGLTHVDSFKRILAIRPHIILLDERLPDIPGHELCKQIKAHPGLQGTVVILISAVQRLEEIALECGADNFITKPFDLETLTGIVKSFHFGKAPSENKWHSSN